MSAYSMADLERMPDAMLALIGLKRWPDTPKMPRWWVEQKWQAARLATLPASYLAALAVQP